MLLPQEKIVSQEQEWNHTKLFLLSSNWPNGRNLGMYYLLREERAMFAGTCLHTF